LLRIENAKISAVQEQAGDDLTSPREYFETVAISKFGFSAGDIKRIDRIIKELEVMLKKQPQRDIEKVPM
jgi:hypothetical protein